VNALFCGMGWHSVHGHDLMLAIAPFTSPMTGSQPRAWRGAVILIKDTQGAAGGHVHHPHSEVTP
jgi:hypothetical protein